MNIKRYLAKSALIANTAGEVIKDNAKDTFNTVKKIPKAIGTGIATAFPVKKAIKTEANLQKLNASTAKKAAKDPLNYH